MVDISQNGIISLNRMDTLELPLFINVGSKIHPIGYKLSKNDILYFAVCEPNQDFECGVIRKIFTRANVDQHGNVVIKLDSSDTEHLLPGNYYYEVKLKLYNNKFSTILPKRKLVLFE